MEGGSFTNHSGLGKIIAGVYPSFLMNKFAVGCGIVVAILLVIVVVAALAIGGSYNRLVRLQQAVDQSWAQVQNVYQRRADLIPNLVNTVSGAANFEKSTLVEVTNARASVGRVQMQLDPNKAPADAAQLQQFQAAQEIGRASCRERVWTAVGGVTV